ncbi:MAG: hypothetical protein JWM27_2060 [Gemmatimonadetes bacterium]|nr:hypothetical protein [Gemmatimonadota bacterium]
MLSAFSSCPSWFFLVRPWPACRFRDRRGGVSAGSSPACFSARLVIGGRVSRRQPALVEGRRRHAVPGDFSPSMRVRASSALNPAPIAVNTSTREALSVGSCSASARR